MKALLTSEQGCVSGQKLVCVSERLASAVSVRAALSCLCSSSISLTCLGGLIEAPLFLLFLLPFSLDSASSERFAAALTLQLNSFWSPYVRERRPGAQTG